MRRSQRSLGRRLTPACRAKQILDDGLIAGMNVVGERFKQHEIFLPDVLMSAKAMYAGLDLLRPLLEEAGVEPLGRVVIGTVSR